MPHLPVSALSAAARELRTLLAIKIEYLDEKHITIDYLKNAIAAMDTDEQNLNLFFFRVEHGGFFPDGSSSDPLYVRLHCLVTALGVKSEDGNTSVSSGENDLRLIGKVIQVLHENPVRTLQDLDGKDIAQLQVVLQSLTLDDINRLWSTQGDTPYRLSVPFEMALVPIPLAEPVEKSQRAGAIGTQVRGELTQEPLPEVGFEIDTAFPQVPKTRVDTRQVDWVPHICFVVGESLQYTLTFMVSDLPQKPQVLIAGDTNKEVTLVWELWDSELGWSTIEELQTNVMPNTDIIDPDQIAPSQARKVPLDKEGQAVLYATRVWTRKSDEVEITVRSNPLLVTVY